MTHDGLGEAEVRGMFRASEVVAAYEATFAGEVLVETLTREAEHAARVQDTIKDPTIAAEWHGRLLMYRAALRRLSKEHHDAVATATRAA